MIFSLRQAQGGPPKHVVLMHARADAPVPSFPEREYCGGRTGVSKGRRVIDRVIAVGKRVLPEEIISDLREALAPDMKQLV
jgi:hypothetical protein